MLIRGIAVLFLLGMSNMAEAQTGPGGVGASSTNLIWLSAHSGVSTSSDAVNAWNDLSGNNNNAVYPSGQPSMRPGFVPGALNGYPVVIFDGINDELQIPNTSALGVIQWDVFMVGAVTNAKNNNVWFAKGNGSASLNYGMWSTSTNTVQMPFKDISNSSSSPSTAANTTGSSFNLMEYYHNWSIFPFAIGRTFLKNGTSIFSQFSGWPPATNTQSLRIGNAQGTTGWNLDGRIAELIMFKSPLNDAQRLIVNNYLAAKYGLSLSSGDIYTQDNVANGDYDHDVAGIGRTSSSSTQTDSRGTGIIQVNNPTGLGDNEFLFWGHNNGALGTYGSTDYPAGLMGRWPRTWRVSEVNASGTAVDVGAVDITFDLTGFGSVTASDLRLLVDANNNNLLADDTPISGAVSMGGNKYKFAGVTALSNGLRFTLGTINVINTPLPIELLYFSAKPDDGQVHLEWATASERDNDHFTVERSKDTQTWAEVARMAGAGTSSERLDYATIDPAPLTGTSYYRLKQTDMDGMATWSDVAAVEIAAPLQVTIFPNPAEGSFSVLFPRTTTAFDVYDAQGRAAHPVMVRYGTGRAEVDASGLAPGVYTLRFAGDVGAHRVIITAPTH